VLNSVSACRLGPSSTSPLICNLSTLIQRMPVDFETVSFTPLHLNIFLLPPPPPHPHMPAEELGWGSLESDKDLGGLVGGGGVRK